MGKERRMSRHEERKNRQRLAAPWRNLHGAIWMVGLAIIAIKGWWWPGILVLVAFSAVFESILMLIFPQAAEPVPPVPPVTPVAPQPPVAPFSNPFQAATQEAEYPAHLLPSNCPRCGAPARGHEVKWTSSHSADCSFCGANLPLGK
jgi:hypothetical protein